MLAWEFHEAKIGEACTWDLDALAEGDQREGLDFDTLHEFLSL